jgi:hypothetical protein
LEGRGVCVVPSEGTDARPGRRRRRRRRRMRRWWNRRRRRKRRRSVDQV